MQRKNFAVVALVVLLVGIVCFGCGFLVRGTINQNINTITVSTAPQPLTERININQVGEETLKSLNGIGDVKAKAIIKNRPYTSIYDLLELSEIGEVTFNNIKDVITCE